MRVAAVFQDRCQPEKCNQECINYCPPVRNGVICIQLSQDTGKSEIIEDLCIGCGICVNKCPFDAIRVVNLADELNDEMVHRFGENAFRLFRLPVPKAGRVIGMLGPNGVGKTTAVNILAGFHHPNLGKYEQGAAPKWDAILDAYSGTEIGEYFKFMQAPGFKPSVKPQYVDKLPQVAKGLVRELLTKKNERGKLDEIVEKMNLAGIMDRELAHLSGGELQRVAIAAAMLADASVYFFDEPSSYLDIFERLRAARAIKELAEKEENRRVLIVEHDLALLDFLADDVHILYGTEGTYGIVTHARPVKASVNTYLSGFLREENVRFRDTEVRFEARPPRSEWKTATLLEFPRMKKRLGDFDLEVAGGSIKVGEVVGIVGPNAVGKTTFVKTLAGVIDPDEGALDSKATTSYKPQYISGEFEDTVESLLRLELQQTFDSSYFEREVMHPLNLKVLLNRDVPTLSGGELQRVAICLCLGREADIYLIDEPSAYLDSNQRVIAAKVIRRIMEFKGKSALVVDHDVYFIDLLCDSLMVFGGEPSKHGSGKGPFSMHEGMNQFLATVDVTFRRDNETKRPRINKPGSVKDREQKAAGEYYYLVEG